MSEYDSAVALAQRLIAKKGRQITLQTLSDTPADTSMPWNGPGTPTVSATKKVKAVFLPHAGSEDLGISFVDKELMKRCEEVALIAGGVVMDSYHTILDGSKVWKIEWIKALKPGDTDVLFAVGVKR